MNLKRAIVQGLLSQEEVYEKDSVQKVFWIARVLVREAVRQHQLLALYHQQQFARERFRHIARQVTQTA